MKLFQSLLFSVLFVSAIIFSGCNEEQTTSVTPDNTTSLSKLTLPAGAVVQNATFNVYVSIPQAVDVSLHKINVPWVEATETFTSFFLKASPQWVAASLGSFDASTVGYKSVEITALVQEWIADPTTNKGILLDQLSWLNCPDMTQDNWLNLIYYQSRENVDKPYLEITYLPAGSLVPVVVQEFASGDTYISSIDPGTPFGDANILWQTRWDDASCKYLKLPLFKFDIEQETTETVCGTGYAYGGNLATCFIGLPGVNSNNWGWTNFISKDASTDYDWPIYVGAGQCDLTKGTLVGYLHVNYNHLTDVLTLDYTLSAGYTNSSLKIWIGSTYLPLKNGKYGTNPGGFNHKEPGVPYTVTGLSSNFYIAAHFDICWQD